MKRIIPFLAICSIALGDDDYHNIHRYFWANYNQFSGNTKAAQEWYTQIFNNQGSIYTFKGFVHFLNDTHQYQQIISLEPQLEKKFVHDPALQLIFALAHRKVGNDQKADAMILAMLDHDELSADIVLHAVDIYVRRKELENALLAIDKLLNRSPSKSNYFFFYFIKAQLNAQLGKLEESLKNIELCLSRQPSFDKGWLFFAALQEQMGSLSQAIKGYTSYLELVPEKDRMIEQHLLQLVIRQQTLVAQAQTVLTQKKECMDRALMLFNQRHYRQALSAIDECLKHTQDAASRLLKIDILVALHEHQKAVDHLAAWIEQEQENQLWYKTMRMLIRTPVACNLVCQSLEKLYAKQSSILSLLYLADIYLKTDQHAAAIPLLKTISEKSDDQTIKIKALFHLGRIYYQQKEFKAMEIVLEQGFTIDPNFTPLANLLAYHYATKGNNLARADSLIKKVLETAPKNPHFLDTQALILYKQKKYEQAETILDALIVQEPKDATILIHAAKAAYKQKKIAHARELIKKARLAARYRYEHEILDKVRKKWHV